MENTTKDEKFILTLTQYDTTITISKNKSDITMEELYDMIKQLILAAGWHPDVVNEYFQ
jgi:hypothetical protein